MRCLSEVMDFFVNVAGPGTKPMRTNDLSKIYSATVSGNSTSSPPHGKIEGCAMFVHFCVHIFIFYEVLDLKQILWGIHMISNLLAISIQFIMQISNHCTAQELEWIANQGFQIDSKIQ